MRIGRRLVAAALLAGAAAAGCKITVQDGGGGGGDDDAKAAAAAQDSVRKADQALRDAGVTVDTQVIDSGQARAEGVGEADPDP